MRSNINLLPTSSKLKPYSGDILFLKHQFQIKFSYEFKKPKTIFSITDEKSLSALIRDVSRRLQLDWKKIFSSYVQSEICYNSDSITLIIDSKLFFLKN